MFVWKRSNCREKLVGWTHSGCSFPNLWSFLETRIRQGDFKAPLPLDDRYQEFLIPHILKLENVKINYENKQVDADKLSGVPKDQIEAQTLLWIPESCTLEFLCEDFVEFI